MKVLFYRDARSMNKYSIAVISEDGVDLRDGVELVNQSWRVRWRLILSSHLIMLTFFIVCGVN